MALSILNAPHFQNEAQAFAYVEARLWPNGPVCPFCGETKRVGRLSGKTTRPGLCKCYACRKPFTVRIGTIFESSHLALHLWLQVIHLMCASKKGISTRQVQRMLQCSMKTAWFLGHRIREAMKDGSIGPLGGAGMTIEADETFVGAEAGKKLGRPPVEKRVVFSLVERDGRVRSMHIPNVRASTLRAAVAENASRASRFMTDERRAYTFIGWNFASHDAVNHKRSEYVRGDAHTNSVEGFFSILKRGLYGTYQHVSDTHLSRYLSEFDFRYSNREKLGIDDVSRADMALQGMKGKRLTYRTTSRGWA
ncbi:MAG: IS1595 family transposase [Alphaproteobacteria bacterium]|nr:IS1595 family transposase [Alphaproteobacteria bacterium]